ncbi:MAG: SET domain-containing protein [Pyrinomonadaceae bacterium]
MTARSVIMRLKLDPGLRIYNSAIEGRGCFAKVAFHSGRKIAEYTGERISNAEANRRAQRRRLRICAIDDRWSLDGSRGGNGTHYINHSCEPNSYMKVLYGHILFMALRDILPGEEITIDYESTLHSNKKRCTCGAPSCRGTINRVNERS